MNQTRDYKIQKYGQRGLCVLLPAHYVKDLYLVKGDVVEVIRKGSRLIIQPKGGKV